MVVILHCIMSEFCVYGCWRTSLHWSESFAAAALTAYSWRDCSSFTSCHAVAVFQCCAALCCVRLCHAMPHCAVWLEPKRIDQPLRHHRSCCQDRNTCAAGNKVCLPLSTITASAVCHHNTPCLPPRHSMSTTTTLLVNSPCLPPQQALSTTTTLPVYHHNKLCLPPQHYRERWISSPNRFRFLW